MDPNVGVIAFAGLGYCGTSEMHGEVIDAPTVVRCDANEIVRMRNERMAVILKKAYSEA